MLRSLNLIPPILPSRKLPKLVGVAAVLVMFTPLLAVMLPAGARVDCQPVCATSFRVYVPGPTSAKVYLPVVASVVWVLIAPVASTN